MGWSEINKYAIQAHNALFPQWADKNYGDITKIEWESVPDFDLFTYSSPCQDFSMAGLQRGGGEGSGTRSSLLWECKKAIRAKRPKYLLQENVKGLVTQKFIHDFRKWEQWLAGEGYNNYCKVLNAKDFNIPQNRERIFMVSILGEGDFEFPDPVPLAASLDDICEENVGEEYYLSEEMVRGLMKHGEAHAERGNGFVFAPVDTRGAAHTIRANGAIGVTDNYIEETD